jgi:hypothetical protein
MRLINELSPSWQDLYIEINNACLSLSRILEGYRLHGNDV